MHTLYGWLRSQEQFKLSHESLDLPSVWAPAGKGKRCLIFNMNGKEQRNHQKLP